MTALPNEEITVTMTNLYTYLNNKRTVWIGNEVRDSVHLLIRAPEGYEILGAKSYVIPDFSFNEYFSQFKNGGIKNTLLKEYTDKMQPMVRNVSLDSRFKGNGFKATNVNDRAKTIPVNTNDGTWVGYSAKVDIRINNGDILDTIFAFDSVKNLLAQFGVDTASFNVDSVLATLPIPIKIDSIGVTTIPILIQATMRTRNTQGGSDTIYYYTKTAKLPAPSLSNESSSGEYGSMMFTTLTIGNASVIIQNSLPHNNTITFKAYPNPFTQTIRFFSSVSNNTPSFSIYSISGNLVNRVNLNQSGFAEWNGTDKNGIPVQSGRYIVRADNHGRSDLQMINLVRGGF
jgi:hypothetical protein